MAYVVMMHLDPSRESQIVPLLQDRSVVPVAQVIEETMRRADHAYVIAPTLFEVSDTGIGITPEHQRRIFDRFWRVEDTAIAAPGGLGIGLAAVREVSRLLGGVESVVGDGSTFRVTVPRVYAPPISAS
ncbi:MAG: hypothetical protein H0X64_15755 [Gemmatimonadaceae bacterium]|nr:hypothetical protein [Gemmatimonadaceae bacterium]